MGVQFAGNILVQSNGGPLPISSGGTGQITAPTAINALLPVQTDNNGKLLSTDGTNVTWKASVTSFNTRTGDVTLTSGDVTTALGYTPGTGTGTVTSVAGTGTVSGLTLTGTVTTSGSLTLGGTLTVAASDFLSQTANTFLSAPNGSSGVPTFRTIVASDVPTLNQSTTGNAATATALATPRAINGINFDGTAPITVTADANTLSGTTLHSTVVSSSLTSIGTLTSLNTTGPVTINNIGTVNTASLVTSTIAADQVLDGIATASYRAATYRISVTYGTDCQYSEVKMIHNTTNVYIGEINTILTGALLATFTADISSGIMRLLTTPVNAITTYKAVSILVAA
jgi:hypothetical protein